MSLIEEKQELILGGSYKTDAYMMISASAEAEKREYELYRGKSGTLWLLSTQENCADNIYCSGGATSQGFGGGELEFKLARGLGSIKLKGPWHSNGEAFSADTGIDVSKKHLSWGCVGLGREFEKGRAIITGLLYFDKEPQIGSFHRVRDIAQEIANTRGETVMCYKEGPGGSSSGQVKPKEEER